jgi:hypothetical protein
MQRFDLPSAIFIPRGANLIESPGNFRISNNAIPADGPDLILSGPGQLFPPGVYGVHSLSFGYVRSRSNRFILLLHRSTDLVNKEEILSSTTSSIPESTETPYRLIAPSSPGNRAFYRLEVIRR